MTRLGLEEITATLPARRQTVGRVPLWLKLAYTGFIALLAPVYWWKYGPANFLWFCDIALGLTLVSLWLEVSLPASMAALGLLPEFYWNLDFFARLVLGVNVGGLSSYMFDGHWPLYLRGLSLFHIFLPVLLIWLIWRLGYDRRALAAQTAVAWVVLPCCYLFTRREANINWVFGASRQARELRTRCCISGRWWGQRRRCMC